MPRFVSVSGWLGPLQLKVPIPVKAVTDSNLIPGSDSDAMPVTQGKRSDAGEAIVPEATGIVSESRSSCPGIRKRSPR